MTPAALQAFSDRLSEFPWVTDLLVAGSLATGDYLPGVSDLDLVAVLEGPASRDHLQRLTSLHRELDAGAAAGAKLGCSYVDQAGLADVALPHPTWTHGALVRRPLSGLTRAELVRHGFAVRGRSPQVLLPAMTDDEVRAAARAELEVYWARTSRWPWAWLDPELADLSLTAMARARHTVRTGRLLTKTEAIEQLRAPDRLVDQLRSRRCGKPVHSPRLATAWTAWRDVRRTLREIRRSPS